VKEGYDRALAVTLSILALLALGVLLKVVAGVFTQVTIALFAMFLVNPAVNRASTLIDGLLKRMTLRRGRKSLKETKESHVAEVMGSVIVILLALLLVGFAILIVYGTGNMLVERKADLVTNVVQPVGEFINGVQQQWLPWLYRSLGMEDALDVMPSDSLQILTPHAKHGADPLKTTLESAFGGVSVSALVPTAANLVGTVTIILFKLAIITMLTVFMLSGRRIYSSKLRKMDSKEYARISRVVSKVECVPRRYLVAKLVTSLLTGLLIGGGLLIWLDPGDAFIWGFIAAVMNFIPFFGSLIAGILIALYTISISGPSGLWSVLLVVVVNNLVSNVIEPNYFGKVLPIGKVTVLVCVLVWGFLWGLPGVFLAVPITIMLKEFLEQVYGRNAFIVALEV
jgi:predicted PurR-regulated permease PerM